MNSKLLKMTSILSPQSCDKTFTTTTQRARHMGEMFTCAICDKSYTRKYRLQQHILGHDPVLKESMKIYECDICHAKFSQKHRLTRHIKSRHLGIKPSVACSKCKKTFTCNHNLREHEKTACPYLKQVVMLTAPVDQSETSVTSDDDMTEYSLQDDVRPMINETQDTTEIETQRANSVSTHSSAESSPTNDVTETDSPPHVTGTNHNTSYSQCQDEQDTISGSFGVESHEMKTEIKEEVVSLRSEVKEEIEEMTPSTDSSTPLLELVPFVQDIKPLKTSSGLTCPTCNKVFASPRLRSLHEARTHAGRLYPCTSCDKSFKRRDTLTRHLRSQHPGISLVQICKPKPRRVKLKPIAKEILDLRHRPIGTECLKCKRDFASKHNLRRHENLSCPCREVVLTSIGDQSEVMRYDDRTGSLIMESQGIRNEIKNGCFDELKNKRFETPNSPCYNTETSTEDNWHQVNHGINVSNTDEKGLIHTTGSKIENCKSRENTLDSTSHFGEIVQPKDVGVEESQSTSTKRQHKIKTSVKNTLSLYSTKHVNDIFCRCVKCLVEFKEAKYLDLRPADTPKEKCDVCHKSVKNLKGHDCLGICNYYCTVCNRGFTSELLRNRHVTVHESKRQNFICAVCKKNFYAKSSLRLHLRTHTGEKPQEQPQSCEYCQKVLKTRKSYLDHKLRMHSVKLHKCSDCSRTFKSKEAIRGHIQAVHLMVHKVKCDLCNVKFATEESLKKHKAKQHSDNKVNRYKIGGICELCGKHFKNKVRLEAHMNIHKGIKPYVCEACGKCFRSVSNLDQHSRTHSDARPYVCDLCGKGFRIRNHLRQHMAVHGLVNTSVKRKRKQRKSIDSDSDSDWLG